MNRLQSISKHIRLVTLSLVAGLVVTMAAAQPVAALPRDTLGHTGASCHYGGVEYSEGSIIKMDDGNYYRCSGGEWKFDKSGRVTTGDFTIQPFPLPEILPEIVAR